MRGRGLAGREARPAGQCPRGPLSPPGHPGERGGLGRQGSGPGKATGRAVCSPGQRAWALGEGCCAKLMPQGITFLRTEAGRCPACCHAHVGLVIFYLDC